MTNEEAKAYFMLRLSDAKYAKGKQTRQREAFEKAIEALEKQIPKKPSKEYEHDGDLDYNLKCLSCGNLIDSMVRPHHCRCGQALLWEADND